MRRIFSLFILSTLTGCVMSHHYRNHGAVMWHKSPTEIVGKGLLLMEFRGSYEFEFDEKGNWKILNYSESSYVDWTEVVVEYDEKENKPDECSVPGRAYFWPSLILPFRVNVQGDFSIIELDGTLGITARRVYDPCGKDECPINDGDDSE